MATGATPEPLPRTRRDDGYFGPDSVAWRVHSSRGGLAGGLRALMVQALNPLAMAAVEQHSNYREDAWGRLLATGQYLADTIFGDTATADRAARRVRAIHARLSGVDEFTGLAYKVDDPDLLLWIHCTEVHSFMAGCRHFDVELPLEDRDRYVAEMVVSAELVGLSAQDVPTTYADLKDYLHGQVLVASPAAMRALRFLLVPPVPWPGGRYPDFPGSRILVVPGRTAWAVPSACAVAILPREAQRVYRLPNLRPLLPSLRPAYIAFERALRRAASPPESVRRARALTTAP